jgi:hypothetical protein
MHTVKVKVTALNAYACTEGRLMYISKPFAHSALEEGCQHHAPAILPQERAPVTIVQEAGWTPGMVQTDTENFACTDFDSLTVQPVACHYKMHAVPAGSLSL